MLLGVWDKTQLKCDCGCGGTCHWSVDWQYAKAKVDLMKFMRCKADE